MAETYEVTLVIDAQNRISATTGAVTRDLNRIDDGLKKVDQSSGTLTRSVTRMQQALELGIAGAMLQKVGDLASNMYEAGNAARIAEQTFTQLAGGSEAATSQLEALRAATGGIINDFSLMEGASKFLSMGLGETEAEVTRLTELAVKLGGAMGNDAATSINDFGLLLANESVLRLDTFGISSERVQRRIDELLASGEALNRSDAFRMAVMEEGSNSLERLGDAANAAETPILRLQTTLENFWSQASQNFAVGVNATIGLVEAVGTRAADSARVYEMASQMFEIPYDTAAGGLIGGVNPFTQDMLDAARAVIEQHDQAMADAARVIAEGVAQSDTNNAARIQAELSAQAQQTYMGYTQSAFGTYNAYNEIGTNAAGNQEWQFSREYVTRAEAEQLRDVANETAETFTYLQGLFDQGLINESAIQSAENLRDMVDATADNAERAANAFEDMSLSQALGEGGGSPLGVDLAGSFLDAAQGLDLGTSEYQQLADVIMLASGEITDASITYRDEVIPLLLQVYQQLGAGAAADAVANVEAYLRDAATQGRTAAQTAAGLALGTGFTTFGGSGFGGGAPITVNSGDTISGLAAQNGVSWDEMARMLGMDNPYQTLMPGTYGAGGGGNVVPVDMFDNPAGLPGMFMGDTGLAEAAEAAREPFDAMKAAVGEIDDDVTNISETLDSINGKEVTVKLTIDQGNVPDWLRQLMEQATIDNGGTSPGSRRTGRAQVDPH